MEILKTSDIKQKLVDLYKQGTFRIGKYGKTVEIQNAHFLVDSDTIIRKPNYDYAKREIEWYESMSLFVKDIPGGPPTIWKNVSDSNGKIHSNYGWCIWSEENGKQFDHCVERLLNDPYTREACMIYNRPSMQTEYNSNGMHDFMCTFCTQQFLNEPFKNVFSLDYTIFQRSCDAVFGYCNDVLWHIHVRNKLLDELKKHGTTVMPGDIIYNCGSLHVYERHFKYLEA